MKASSDKPDTASFRIDAHKLHLHPQRVADWLNGKNIAPIYIEVSPSGACNHRCVFCGKDFMGYRPRFLPTELFCRRLEEMGAMGVKSIMYAGEGEPFLHRDMGAIAEATSAAGIDVAFTTNAVRLTPEAARRVLPVTRWIKVSCNAGSAPTYSRIHRTDPQDFEKVLANMEKAVQLRSDLGSSCTLGFQMVLLPENQAEALPMARRLRDMGVDYFVIKPYSQHPESLTTTYADISYRGLEDFARELSAVSRPGFSVIFRQEAARRHEENAKGYERCLALPFWCYIDAGGTVWGCSMFLQRERFDYGNLNDAGFADIWNGEKRKAGMEWCAGHLHAENCRINCRMDAVNRYLWELKRPSTHANFI